jgi:hypothetical protein
MTFPSLPGQQERVARETMAELRAGRPVQLFVTDFPRIKFNHSVLAFDYRAGGSEAVDFIVYDPNDPAAPGTVRFDPRDERHPRPSAASRCPTSVPSASTTPRSSRRAGDALDPPLSRVLGRRAP